MRASLFSTLRLGALLASAALILSACGGSDAVKPAELQDFKSTARAQVAWRTSVGDAKSYALTPAVQGDTVFVAGRDGRVMRLNANSGKEVWRIDTKETISGGVGADGDLVLVGTNKGMVLAYDVNGKPRWRSQVSSEILSAPRAAGNMVAVRTGDGRIFGLDAASGERKWEYAVTLPALLLRTNAGLLIHNDLVIAGLPGGRVTALNLANGSVAWDTLVAPPKGDNELERISDIAGALAVQGESACAAAYQGRVACLDIAKGSISWGRDGASVSSVSGDAITLYLTDPDGVVMAYDRESGATVWKQDKLLNREVSAPVPAKEHVIVGDLEGYVHVLSLEDGSFAARLKTDGSPIVVQPVAGGPGVIVQTQEGGVYAISIK